MRLRRLSDIHDPVRASHSSLLPPEERRSYSELVEGFFRLEMSYVGSKDKYEFIDAPRWAMDPVVLVINHSRWLGRTSNRYMQLSAKGKGKADQGREDIQ